MKLRIVAGYLKRRNITLAGAAALFRPTKEIVRGAVADYLDKRIAHAVVAEQINLLQHLIVIVDLRVTGREHMVPEQRHLLFQRALRGHQIIHVVDVAHRRHPAG